MYFSANFRSSSLRHFSSTALDEAIKHFAVEALDEHTLKVTLASPNSYFLARVAYVYPFFPAPSSDLEGKSSEEIDRYFNQPAKGKPMVLGAYLVENWEALIKK